MIISEIIPSAVKIDKLINRIEEEDIKILAFQRGFVQLIVYDMLGRKVANLVNKEQPVGNYKIDFNASGLSSGIYFYRIQIGDFSETKKLVLLR